MTLPKLLLQSLCRCCKDEREEEEEQAQDKGDLDLLEDEEEEGEEECEDDDTYSSQRAPLDQEGEVNHDRLPNVLQPQMV